MSQEKSWQVRSNSPMWQGDSYSEQFLIFVILNLDMNKEPIQYPRNLQQDPTEWTPKPVYLIALVPYIGVRW